MPVIIDKLSVFFPAYNEEANIARTVTKAKAVLEKIAGEWEILIINDGSKDRTGEVAQNLANRDPRIKVITHSPNRGYGASLKSGFYGSRFPWICFTDSDGQFDFSEVTGFIKTQKKTNADLVVGYYRKRQVSLFRKVNTFFWELVVFLLFGLKVKDIDCGFKFISKKVIDTIPKLESERGAFISSEFLVKAKRAGFSMVEIPVSHFPATRKGTGADLNVIIKSFVDLFRLWRKLR
jgi:glycosyltransferase involved in cell wall biosynthesis